MYYNTELTCLARVEINSNRATSLFAVRVQRTIINNNNYRTKNRKTTHSCVCQSRLNATGRLL